MDYIWFWMAKPLGEILWAVGFILLLLALLGLWELKDMWAWRKNGNKMLELRIAVIDTMDKIGGGHTLQSIQNGVLGTHLATSISSAAIIKQKQVERAVAYLKENGTLKYDQQTETYTLYYKA